MTPENLSLINQSFSIQASNFDSPTLQFSKADYLNHVLEAVSPAKSDLVLEVAAGTLRPDFFSAVQTVVCLDATLPMLEAGKAAADKSGLTNLIFEKGFAEDLPFLSRSFDLVMSRLAFHHFSAPVKAFEEMVRVLKPEGRLIMSRYGRRLRNRTARPGTKSKECAIRLMSAILRRTTWRCFLSLRDSRLNTPTPFGLSSISSPGWDSPGRRRKRKGDPRSDKRNSQAVRRPASRPIGKRTKSVSSSAGCS